MFAHVFTAIILVILFVLEICDINTNIITLRTKINQKYENIVEDNVENKSKEITIFNLLL